MNSFEHTDEGFKHSDEWIEDRGLYKLNQTLDYGSIQYSPSLDYEIEIDGKIFRPGNVSKEEMIERQKRNPSSDFCWRWSRELFDFGYQNGFVVIKENGSNRIYTKTYQNAFIVKNGNSYIIELKPRMKSLSSLDFIENKYSNDNSKRDLTEIFDENVFDYSKPVSLIKTLAFLGCNANDIFLDFFGGSGTTGQAIMELNLEQALNLKYIVVQIPEAIDVNSEAFNLGYKKISDITIERNKRVINKIIEEKKNQTPNLFTNGHKEDALNGLGFKVFKLAKSNFPRIEFAPDTEKTEEENIELLKKYIAEKEAQLVNAFNREELFTEILLKNGFNLNYKIEKQPQFEKNDIFLATDGEKEILICLDYVLDNETISHFKTNTNIKFICLQRALDTTKKYNLKHYMGNMFKAF